MLYRPGSSYMKVPHATIYAVALIPFFSTPGMYILSHYNIALPTNQPSHRTTIKTGKQSSMQSLLRLRACVHACVSAERCFFTKFPIAVRAS